MRTTPLTAGLALALLLATGCAEDDPPPAEEGNTTAEEEPAVQPTASPEVTASTFLPPGETAGAVTYDETAVPEGSTADVQVRVQDGETFVQFTATDLEPDRDFGAHVHTEPCGDDPDDAGPHYQDEEDPEAEPDSPSTDPEYANPENEVWLDFTTDDSGNAVVDTTVPWEFREGRAQSLVLHEEHTSTEPGEAGMAGDRLACVTVDF